MINQIDSQKLGNSLFLGHVHVQNISTMAALKKGQDSIGIMMPNGRVLISKHLCEQVILVGGCASSGIPFWLDWVCPRVMGVLSIIFNFNVTGLCGSPLCLLLCPTTCPLALEIASEFQYKSTKKTVKQ